MIKFKKQRLEEFAKETFDKEFLKEADAEYEIAETMGQINPQVVDGIFRADKICKEIDAKIKDLRSYMEIVGTLRNKHGMLLLWEEFHSYLQTVNGLDKAVIQKSLKLGLGIAGHEVPSNDEDGAFMDCTDRNGNPCEYDIDECQINNRCMRDDEDKNWYQQQHKKWTKGDGRELIIKIVKLMAKAGTQKDGLKAAWSNGEIGYGFKIAEPELRDDVLRDAVQYLVRQEVLIEKPLGKCNETVYFLTDGYQKYLSGLDGTAGKEHEVLWSKMLQDQVRVLLRSNRDEAGKILPWTWNQMYYAIKGDHPMVLMGEIKEALNAAAREDNGWWFPIDELAKPSELAGEDFEKKVFEYTNKKYTIVIQFVEEEYRSGYYFAYIQEFGQSACSATGVTHAQAIERLEEVKEFVIRHYLETGKEIPEPVKAR